MVLCEVPKGLDMDTKRSSRLGRLTKDVTWLVDAIFQGLA